MEVRTVYFEKRGPENTVGTLELAKERADALGLEDVVVASLSGDTGARASEVFKGYNFVVVAGVVGFREPNKVRLLDKNRAVIEKNGGKIIFAGHAFGMLGRAVKNKFGAIQVDELIAQVLRLFGSGVKVGCEVTCMAVDAGLVASGKEVIAIGGSAKGADTAVVLKAANTHNFFDTRILEIICKPRE
ncbi:MAG: hypothetical protein JRH06_02045 [Deltaproteobacteria bacterium]|nr:hypothetical protein [Deltaproteobacteria bacterium]MBW2136324.1 hypothetical protein [Deltaproteobacteria bacterium]